MPFVIASYRTSLVRAMFAAVCFGAIMVGVLRSGCFAIACEPPQTRRTSATPLAIATLPNAYRLHAQVISGGQPDGEAGFRALRELGVRTVISVDGAKPEVSLAKEVGLRYVHLPHGYDGIPETRVLELTKAVRELPGPVYIHCHHGQHRSPAAAAVACIAAGLIDREAGQELLRLAGTGNNYRGLYEAVAAAELREDAKDLKLEFREIAEIPPMAAAMVQLERTLDNLKQIERAGWVTDPAHPDLTPAHEALLLRERFTELLRTDEVRQRTHAFRQLLERSRAASESLETQLRDDSATRPATAAARHRHSAALASIDDACVHCHRAHRD